MIAALFGCVSTGISVFPVEAVPIARGLSTLAVMFEDTSPQKAERISFIRLLSSCGTLTTNLTPAKLTLLTIRADDAFDLSIQSGGANGGTQ